MTVFNVLQNMLKEVAKALGPDMCRQMTFVGGCTTGLLLTDDFTREQVRSTEDVDLIVHVLGPIEFGRLQERLYERGFRLSPADEGDDLPICAMKLGELRVDFMPDNDTLGFSNRWYKDAMATATSTWLPRNGKPGMDADVAMRYPAETLRTFSTWSTGAPSCSAKFRAPASRSLFTSATKSPSYWTIKISSMQ